jgi:adenylate cyclase
MGQWSMRHHCTASAPRESIRFRIGINLGDVMIDGEDLYGDGVNIAARLEALSEPGGVVLSAAAFDQVTGKLPASFRDLGERTLKNITRPVRVYALDATPSPAAAGLFRLRWQRLGLWVVALLTIAAVAGATVWRLQGGRVSPDRGGHALPPIDRPAIAALPFTNLADPMPTSATG